MQTSTVKWFDPKKGYGFIDHPEEGEDVFVHYSNIESDDDFKTLQSGQRVRFEMDDGPKGLHAPEVVPLEANSEEDQTQEPDDASTEIDPTELDPTANVNPSFSEGGSSPDLSS